MVLKSARCSGAPRPALWLVCAAALAALATAQAHAHDSRKRAELMQDTYLPEHQMPSREQRAQSKFWSGSRYGRSGWSGHGGGVGGPASHSQPRLEVEPRGDRFFMGSRYGKRAGRYPARTRMVAYDGLAVGPFELPPPLAGSLGLGAPRLLRPRR